MSEPELRELARVLADHGRRYPRMAPRDGVKLIYQNEFGGEHLVSDPAGSLSALRAEHAAVARDPSLPLLEDIGNGMVRVMLAAVDKGEYPLEELARDFVRSARRQTGSREGFLRKLEVLRRLARRGELPFSGPALEEELGPYLRAGCPPVSHSPGYRAAYRPAYRVVRRSAAVGLLVRAAARLRAERGRVLVALDGRCAAGKTTLAAELSQRYGWAVVHLDHFFLRPEQRTPARYAAPGENIDHERVLDQVLLPLRAGRAAEYRPFDCHAGRLGEPVRVPPAPVTLVEGSYACHPALRELYDLRVFLTVPPEVQLERLERRNGACAEVFRTRWIPLEERYFQAERVRERCDLTLEL